MQVVTVYLRVNDAKAVLVDEYNQVLNSASIPAITRGVKCDLLLKLLDAGGAPYPAPQLESLVAWDFVLADDWLTETVPQIRVFNGITVSGNEIRIPLSDTNTVELIAFLGNNATKPLGAELAGFEPGETHPAFLIQFDVSVRNRRSEAGTGLPTEVPDGSYTAAQVNALLRSKPAFRFSADGEEWHEKQDPVTDKFFQFSYLEGAWSGAIQLLQGNKGEQGEQGIQGKTGKQGIQGEQGIRGEKGENGEPAPLTLYQYSINGESWHDEVRATDEYERTSTDGGQTWSGAKKFRGPEGKRGEQGATGPAGAGWNDLPAGSATHMAYIQHQTVKTFEMGEDNEVLTSHNGFPEWKRSAPLVPLSAQLQLSFNAFNSYQLGNTALLAGSFTGGAVNTPDAAIGTNGDGETDYNVFK